MENENTTSGPPVLTAIRQKCLDCVCGSPMEVKLCAINTCSLHPFRFGSNPFRKKREMSDEQKSALAERLKTAREARSNDHG